MAVVIKVGETEAVSVDIGEKVYIQGDPGFSPTIEVTDITGGHRLTITDINGDKTVDVMNGAKGDTGATGNGIEYITLNADYTLTVHYTNGTSWTSASIRGEKGDKGDTGDTGPIGPTGQPGQTGATPDISIGTVETLPPGSPATATITGTAENPVLSFGIPQGQQGAPGEVTQAEFDDLADEVSQQKSAITNLEQSTIYTVELDTLWKAVPFFVNAGDTVSVKSADGSAMTVGQIRFVRSNGSYDYWTIQNYTERKITMSEDFAGVYISNGTAQEIVVTNNSSPANFQPQIDAISAETNANTETLEIMKPIVGINEPTYTVTDGKYISSSGSITDGSAFQYSAPIPVYAGQKVSLYARGYGTSVAMISTVNSSGGDITPVVISTATELLTYEYTVSVDGYIAISYSKNADHKLTIYTYRIDKLESVITDVVSVDSINPAVNAGYIHRDGRIMEASNFRYTNPIRLENETITFKAKGYSDIVSLLSVCDQNGGNRLNIVNSTNSDVVELSYKSNGVTYIIISSNATQPIVYTTAKNILPDSIPYVNLSMFEKFGVVGDSYASGALFFNNTEKDDYTHSWGQIMARNHGTTCTNYSKGGLSTRTWLTDNKGLSLMQASDPEDIYYIALGINDYYSLGTDYLGSISDITSHSSYTDYPDTFYGNYGKIIEQIQAHAPHCKIVMFTIAGSGTNTVKDAYNTAIVEISSHYGLPYIVQDDDPFFVSDFYNKTKVEGHPIAITYSGMADAFERLLISCIRNNVAYFKNTFWYD